MSTDENSAKDILTSKSEDMESTEINVTEATDDLEIVYSHTKNDIKRSEQIGSTKNVFESSSETNLENDPTNDRLGITEVESGSVRDDAIVKKNTLSDTNNEIKSSVVRVEENSATKTTNLTEATYGLITQDQIIANFISNEKIDQTCQIVDLETNLKPPSENKDTTTRTETTKTVNSLSCLATEYASSDSEEDERIPSPCEMITIVDDHDYKRSNKTQYRTTQPVDVDSTSGDTDSDSSDDSSTSSDSDSESDSDSIIIEDGPDNVTKAQPSKTKKMRSEFEDLPPIEELKITVPEELCDRLGEVSGIVEQLVIVRPISGKPTLNLDTVLFLEKGHRVLGQVFDVFGQVADPHYCVRFNSEDHIKQSGIALGMEVYYSPSTEHTSLVFLHELVKLKGIDVSGEDDIEPPEFSDDEEERAYNQLQRQKQRQKPGMNERQDNTDVEGLPQKRQCPDRQRNPWSSDWPSQNYSNPRPNRSFGQGPPRWNSPSFQNPFFNQGQSQPPPNQYGPSNTFNTPQYQYNPYNNPYQQNNMFPPANQRYAFGRAPGFRPDFNNYEPNLYRPNSYSAPPMSWAPPPPPPPPPSM